MLIFAVLFTLCACNDNPNYEESTTNGHINEVGIPVVTEEVEPESVESFEVKESPKSQIGLVVDSWLKIVSLGERDGRLCAFVRNVSDTDIQYAVLTVVCDGEALSFTMSTITAGSSAVLICDTDAQFSSSAQYYSWKITDKVVFTEELSLHADIFEIGGNDGVITVKNISGKAIDGVIYIYYKTVENGVFTEGTTYRIGINGLGVNAQTEIQADNYKKDSSKVLFVTYVQ